MDRTRRKDKIARTTTCLLCPSSELDLHNAGKTKAVNNASCVLLTCWVTAASCAAVLLHADSVSNYQNTAKGRTEHMCVEDSTLQHYITQYKCNSRLQTNTTTLSANRPYP